MTELLGTAWPLPVGGLVFGLVSYAALWVMSRRLDRKYGSGR